jgi:hypothetical protein
VGLYQSLFFKSWSVVVKDVREASQPHMPTHTLRRIVTANTAEAAIDKMKQYLTNEGFMFGVVTAELG